MGDKKEFVDFSSVEAEIPAEKPKAEQTEVNIEKESFDAGEVLAVEKDRLDKFKSSEEGRKIARALELVSTLALSSSASEKQDV